MIFILNLLITWLIHGFVVSTQSQGDAIVISKGLSIKKGGMSDSQCVRYRRFSCLKSFNSDNFLPLYLQKKFTSHNYNKGIFTVEHGYLIHSWSDTAFKGTVVSRTWESLVNTTTISLRELLWVGHESLVNTTTISFRDCKKVLSDLQ